MGDALNISFVGQCLIGFRDLVFEAAKRPLSSRCACTSSLRGLPENWVMQSTSRFFSTYLETCDRLRALSVQRGPWPPPGDMMRLSIAFSSCLCLAMALPVAQAQTRKTLDIYVVDVEGGNATLFMAP